MRVAYLVSPNQEHALEEARRRGWARIALRRFVTPDRLDVRAIFAMRELVPFEAATPMIKGDGYANGVAAEERAAFDRFVADGNGEWVTLPEVGAAAVEVGL